MSNHPSPGTLIEEDDPAVIKALLRSKRSSFAARAEQYADDPALSEAENAAQRMLFDEETAQLIRIQIALVMKIRGITTAPKRKAAKRPKAASINFDEFEADIMNLG